MRNRKRLLPNSIMPGPTAHTDRDQVDEDSLILIQGCGCANISLMKENCCGCSGEGECICCTCGFCYGGEPFACQWCDLCRKSNDKRRRKSSTCIQLSLYCAMSTPFP